MRDVRYAIADLEASGEAALLVLSAIAMARLILTGESFGNLDALVHELSTFANKAAPDRIPLTHEDFGRTKPPEFRKYFDPEASTTKKGVPALKRGSVAFSYFLDFANDQIRQINEKAGVRSGRDAAWSSRKAFSDWSNELKKNDKKKDPISDLIPAHCLVAGHPGLTWPGRQGTLSVPAFSRVSLELYLSGLSKRFRESNSSAGIYAVFREARGVFAKDKSRLNMIVRDILWLRRATVHQEGKKSVTEMSGFYFSAVDGFVYEIDHGDIVREGYMQMFGGRIDDDGIRDRHHFYLTLPHKGDLKIDEWSCRAGLICGSTSSAPRSPGAWKILAAQQVFDERLYIELETIYKQDRLLLSSADTTKVVEVKKGIDDDHFVAINLGAMVDFLRAKEELGILASHAAASDAKAKKELLKLRRTLKTVLWSGMEPQIDEVTEALFLDLLNEKARTAFVKLGKSGGSPKTAQEFLRELLASWRHLDALHIFSSAKINDMPSASRELVRELLHAKPIKASN